MKELVRIERENKMKLRKIVCFLLALVMLLSFFGCRRIDKGTENSEKSSEASTESTADKKPDNKKNDKKEESSSKEEQETQTAKLENVYKAEYIKLDGTFENVNSLQYFEDKLYFGSYFFDGEAYKFSMFEMGLDGTNIRQIPVEANENANVMDFFFTKDGNIVYFQIEYDYGEDYSYSEGYALKVIDREGKLIREINLDALDESEETLYFNSIDCDDDGNFYLISGNKLFILDSAGNKLFDIEATDYIQNLLKMKDGTMIVSDYSQNGLQFRKIDLATQSLSEPLPADNLNYDYGMMDGVGDYDMYLQGTLSIYGYNFDTQKLEELVNWINSDINTDLINTVTVLPDGRFACYSFDWETSEKELIILTKLPADQIPHRTIITLATTYIDYDVKKAITEFNKTNEKYRITINDYSIYNTYVDYTAGYNRFKTDLISGNIPDIIVSESNSDLSPYTSKGMFIDLYTLFDSDSDYSHDDFVQSFMKACETDGRLYFYSPSFSIQTYAAKTSLVGEKMGWTMQDLRSLMQRMPDSNVFSEMAKRDVLTSIIASYFEQFVDKNSGKCSFSSQEFIDLLEFCNTFPDEIDYEAKYGEDVNWEEYQIEYENMYRKNKVLLMNAYINDFLAIRRIERGNFGEPITFIGFPTTNGIGSTFNCGVKLSIAAKSKNVEGAWEFIKMLMSDEFLRGRYDFPVRIEMLNEKIEANKKPYTYEDEKGNIIEQDNTYWISTGEINIGYPDDADVQKVMDLINATSSIFFYDQALMEIIQEEASYYFAGQKTASNVADIIQSRASIYIAESR